MENFILSPIPLSLLEESISKIIEAKIREHLPIHIDDNKNKYAIREQVANMLHISKPTLHLLTKEGTLTGYKIGDGSRVLYDVSEVEAAVRKIATTKYKRNKIQS